MQDLVADEYQGVRDAWVSATFGPGGQPAADLSKQLKAELPTKLSLFEALYNKYKVVEGSPYLSESARGVGLWGDAAVFALLHDLASTGYVTEETLEPDDNLSLLFKSMRALPRVSKALQQRSA